MQTTLYNRKPLQVEAVQVTLENLEEIAIWCRGGIYTQIDGTKYLEVKVLHPNSEKQSRAYVGDWLLKSKQGFKIYVDTAFRKGFEVVKDDSPGQRLRDQLSKVNAEEIKGQVALGFQIPPAMDTI